MDFKTLLIYVPATDFTQPHPAIPYLAGYLRQQGETVTINDLNIEAYETILSETFLEKCKQKVQHRLAILDKKNTLNFLEKKEYLKCLEAMGVNPKTMKPEQYLKGFREKERFYNFKEYQQDCALLLQAFTLISGAYYPTQVEAGGYTNPFFLSSRADIIAQTDGNVNPFIEYYQEKLLPLVTREKPDLIGISVTYHSQVLQMFVVAELLKNHFPGIHICAGGAFLTRLVANMPRKKLKTLFQYLDSIIMYEGETALHKLILHLKTIKEPSAAPVPPPAIPNLIYYDRPKYDILFPQGEPFVEDLNQLPPPDFDGYPLDHYFSPQVVLPYAPTRGCYWNKCAFCHYGATKEGTAQYRERGIKNVVDDMDFLAHKYKLNHFALSIDVMSPVMALHLAAEISRRQRPYLWNSEIKIEKVFTPENCLKLKQGGCVSVALGLESGNQRILDLIEKGFSPETASTVIQNFANAGISVQVMSFLDFPTETTAEALETIEFIATNKEYISLFTLGNFELLPGSRIYKNPQAYGLTNLHYGEGDEFRVLCLCKEKKASKSESDAYRIDAAYVKMAEGYSGLEFPFVGGVSTNHTFLYFQQYGKDIFKNLDLHVDTREEEPTVVLDLLSKPKLNPHIKVLEGNFSLGEINETIEKDTYFMKESMKKGGLSYRQALYKILNKNKVEATPAFYILMEDMKWSQCPPQVKEILAMCDGETPFKTIIESKGESNKEFIQHMLNQFLSLNIMVT